MHLNFTLILVLFVFISGIISLLDILYLARRRNRLSGVDGQEVKLPLLIEYSRSFFPILFIVLLFRSFVIEPFRIPSGSLKPTLLIGDFVLVNKYHYGLRWPLLNKKFYSINDPKVGDIVVFHGPHDPGNDYIKRIIGKSGDRVQYIDKELIINGKKAEQQFIGTVIDGDGRSGTWRLEKRLEFLNDSKHFIYVRPGRSGQDFDVVVPEGHYFAMGDNRDDSSDSRYWGTVPDKYLLGRAFAIWMSWDSPLRKIRWHRIGKRIE